MVVEGSWGLVCFIFSHDPQQLNMIRLSLGYVCEYTNNFHSSPQEQPINMRDTSGYTGMLF